MSQSEMFALLSSDELVFDHDDLGGFHKAWGFGSANEWNVDLEHDEYEETIELAEALATMEW